MARRDSKLYLSKYWKEPREAPIALQDALYAYCEECERKLEWEAYFDADGTSYGATCDCPNRRWYMSTATMMVNYSE